MNKIKVGIVGAGSFFLKRYLEEINNEKKIVLTSLCRTNKKNLKKVGKLTKIKKLYTDAESMYKNEKLDFVLITSPHTKHFEHIKQALLNKINVLVEKPLVVNKIEKEKIKLIIKKSKKKIISIFNPAYESHFCDLHQKIKNKRFGNIKYVNIFWSDNKKNLYKINKYISSNNIKSKNFRFKKNNTDGSILFDSTSHLIAELLWITKKVPKQVYACADSQIKPLSIKMSFNFGDNLHSDINIICDAKHKKRKFESVYWGDYQKITIKGKPVKMIIENLKNNKIFFKNKFKNVNNPIQEMVDYLIVNKKPLLNLKLSLNVISILLAVEKSFKTKNLVNIEY